MKRYIRITALIMGVTLMLALFAGCAKKAAKTDIGLLNTGILKVGSEIGYPPFEFYADDGVTPMGLDVDLANAIAEHLGIKAEFEDTAWEGIFSGLGIDKYDVVMSSVTITGERKLTMDFSNPYIENWQSIVVKKGSAPITSVEGLEGLLVGYQGATTSDEYLADMIDTGVVNCRVAAYDKVLNCFDDLRLGRIDAAIVDSVVSEGYVDREPDTFEITWHQKNVAGAEPELFGVAIKKGNTKLLEAVNGALAALEQSGKLDEIRQNWLS